MNAIDWIIVAVIGASVLYGLYRGLMQSVLSLICFAVSLFLAFSFSPRLAEVLAGQTDLKAALTGYTDAFVRVGDAALAAQPVSGVDAAGADTILKAVNLPEPLSRLLRNGLLRGGEGTVNDTVKSTIVSGATKVIAFILTFFAAYLALLLVLGLVRRVLRFPVLRQLDHLAGGLFGLARGALIIWVLMLLEPLARTVIVDETAQKLLDQSRLLPYFTNPALFLSVVKF